jgi:UDPglucose--hexose-1-phosphate uridylyltransferase
VTPVETRPHRRRNPLTGQWVLVSPQRTMRPWQGQNEPRDEEDRPSYDPACYLCPGNRRAGGAVNPPYQTTFVFDNDFAALDPGAPGAAAAAPVEDELFHSEPVRGTCRVVCYSPRHDLTLADLPRADLLRVIDVWAAEVAALGERHAWVQVFENKGAVMGCSNPHPHGQIWATSSLPAEAVAEDQSQRIYLRRQGRPLLIDYADRERQAGARLVLENAHWQILVPFWAVWPFEIIILPRRLVPGLPELLPTERAALADALTSLMRAYDGLFDVSFPYSFGWHGAPRSPGASARAAEHWQLHGHVYPPLLRSATVKKYMVGYELLAEPQRDLTPEAAAERLRAVLR